MAFSKENYSKLRPYAYHLTSVSNLANIAKQKQIFSATKLLISSGRRDLLALKRKESEQVKIGGNTLMIRDQSPLHEGNMTLPKDYSFSDFIKYLNGHVFFWPGDEDSPIPYGQRHFERYKHQKPAIIRIEISALLAINTEPYFSKCNSGSPRCSKGKGVPRGPNTFVTCDSAPYTAGQVKELVFKDHINLGAVWEYQVLGQKRWKKV